jgi:methylmalonyl-CoA/ethylmalonyl-CoA epimerase
MSKPLEFSPDQIGILVHDITAAVPLYSAIFGVREWRLWTYGPDVLASLTYRGQPGEFAMRLALSDSTPQLELIEPIRGPSIYEEWLAKNEPGLHHIGTFVPSLDDAAGAMREAGYELIQGGRGYGASGDGGFAYFDTAGELGIITEVVEIPDTRRPPEAIWSSGRWHRTVGLCASGKTGDGADVRLSRRTYGRQRPASDTQATPRVDA